MQKVRGGCLGTWTPGSYRAMDMTGEETECIEKEKEGSREARFKQEERRRVQGWVGCRETLSGRRTAGRREVKEEGIQGKRRSGQEEWGWRREKGGIGVSWKGQGSNPQAGLGCACSLPDLDRVKDTEGSFH